MIQEELNKILQLHRMWLNNEVGGQRADLSGADLSGAHLSCANLSGANLDKEEQFRKGVILKEKIIGYKKLTNNIIATLEIPKGAIVFSINNSKCRTNKAKCIELSNNAKIGYSQHDKDFTYEIGKEYEIEDFELMYNVECASGIHFFKTLKEAEKY